MTVRVKRLLVAPAVSRISVQILPLLLLVQLATVHCAHVFDSYRVAQFDRQGAAFGSRRVTVNHVAVSSKVTRNTESMREKGGDLSRMMAVVRLAEASTEKLQELVDQRRASSVLILLPTESDLPSSLSADPSQSAAQKVHASAVRDLEKFLLSREFDVPIYFAFEDQELQGVVEQLDANPTQEGATDRFQFVVSASEATAVPSATVNNFQGWVHAAHSSTVDSDSQSTIAVVASYDAFSAAPDLASGADQNGSGVTALLEIARIFARLYSDYRTQGSTNLLFLLTGAGRFNYAGDKHWLSHVEPRVLDSIEFALCLDGIAGEKLHLHVSKPPKTPEIKALYETFRGTASSMGVPFEIVHKKINISNPVHDWQHELYSRKRIVSATLSSQPAPTPLFSGSSILDRASQINHDRLITNIRFVAEALSKHVYRAHSKAAGAPKHADRRESEAEDDAAYSLSSQPVEAGQSQASQVVGHSHDVNPHVVGSWVRFLAANPRAQPFLDKKSPVTAELEKTLAKYTADPAKTTFALDAEYTFYQSPEGRTQMSVYKVKPLLFDIFLAAAIGAYLFALYAATKYNSVSEIFGKSS